MADPGSALASFEKMLAAGKDGALLRYSLGNEYLKANEPARAAEHLARAVALDPRYTAAWKLYGKALARGRPRCRGARRLARRHRRRRTRAATSRPKRR